MDINLVPAPAGSVLPYTIEIKGWPIWGSFDNSDISVPQTNMSLVKTRRKHKSEYSHPFFKNNINSVARYDRLAFRYVSYVAIPLLAGYTIYSLLYETHRGWYSFVISTLTSFVYMFGFVSSFE